jgi:hypothetical protein
LLVIVAAKNMNHQPLHVMPGLSRDWCNKEIAKQTIATYHHLLHSLTPPFAVG